MVLWSVLAWCVLFIRRGACDATELAAADVVLMQVCLPSGTLDVAATLLRALRPGARVFAFCDFASALGERSPLRYGFAASSEERERDHDAGDRGGPDGGDVFAPAAARAGCSRYATSWSAVVGHPFFRFHRAERPDEERAAAASSAPSPASSAVDATGSAVAAAAADAAATAAPVAATAAIAAANPTIASSPCDVGTGADAVRGAVFASGAAVDVGFALLPGVVEWYPGWVVRRHVACDDVDSDGRTDDSVERRDAEEDGTYDVLYAEEGTVEEAVAASRLRCGSHAPITQPGGE